VTIDFLADHGRVISSFPCSYMGLPLHVKKLSRSAFQQLIQKIGDKLSGWKRNFLSYPGWELMVKTMLSTMTTYFLTIYKMPKWGIQKIDKFRKSFLGKDSDNIKGGHCLVNWQTCLRPRNLGGLGIKDLDKFSRAFRLHWMWHK
jgi:hypothetical protein